MAFTIDTQKPIKRFTARNPGVRDGTINLEFTYPPENGSPGVDYVENASFSQTVGGQQRKQSDSWVRRVNIRWIEPSNFIPTKMFEIMRGSGNRARNALTYVHHREILSQLPGTENEFQPGIGQLFGHIISFKAKRIGRDSTGTQMYRCNLIFQEADEVKP